jgi:hypothetical protein
VFVKSLILDNGWPENMFIYGNIFHLTSLFCKVKLTSTQNYKMESESSSNTIDLPVIGFPLSNNLSFISTYQTQ